MTFDPQPSTGDPARLKLEKAWPRSGLYAVTTDRHENTETLVAAVSAALRGGASVIQYRNKSSRDRLAEARHVLAACRRHGVPLIINDDVELAAELGADGVHLGRDDVSLTEARARLGVQALIGISCYDSMALARSAEAQGADYVAFGRFFPSQTKPNAPRARLETLREAKLHLRIPVVAIGGITPHNAPPLLEAGADFVAVIESVFGADDPEDAARQFQRLFNRDRD